MYTAWICDMSVLDIGRDSVWVSRVTRTSYMRSCRRPLSTWWRHQMETYSALLAICAGNSPVTGEFPTQRPVTQSFDVFFHLSLIKRLNKQSRGWWFETPSRPLWRHCNETQSVFRNSFINDFWVDSSTTNIVIKPIHRAAIVPPNQTITHPLSKVNVARQVTDNIGTGMNPQIGN